MQFFKEHFDKFLLTGLFLVMVSVVLTLVWVKAPNDTISWAIQLTSGFQGALLGLITGVAIGMKIAGSGNTVTTSAPSVSEIEGKKNDSSTQT